MPIAIRADTLIDGSGSRPAKGALILIEGDKFERIDFTPGPCVPEGYEVIDARGYTILPGLIDSHVHIQGSGDPEERTSFSPLSRSIPAFTLDCYRNALSDLNAGYTTIRDASCRDYADVAVRDAINSGRLPGPRLWVSGQGITSTSGHMDPDKAYPPHMHHTGPSTVADSPDEARRAVRQNLKYNVDIIKTNVTISEWVRRYDGYCAPEMTKEVMQAIADEAHWHGRKVTAHSHGGIGVIWAIEAGIDALDHGFFMSDEHFDKMLARGTALCPTLSVMGRGREFRAKGVEFGPPELQRWHARAISHCWNTVSRAHELGVKIIAGSDAVMEGVRHGTNAYELEMLCEAGLSPMEALVSSTSLAAEVIGFTDVGLVAPGKLADLVFVDGDPLADIRVLQDLKKVPVVIKGGKVLVDRRAGKGIELGA